jgi:hypothetical protein
MMGDRTMTADDAPTPTVPGGASGLTFHCPHCQRYIGDVLGPNLLRINGIDHPVRRRLDLLCPDPKCRRHITWCPESQIGLDKASSAVQQ